MTNFLRPVNHPTIGSILIPVLAFLFVWSWAIPALAKGPLTKGQTLPDLELSLPSESGQIDQLGLQAAKGQTFRISQIKQPWVLIEIFNMYCTICQGEAARVNQLYTSLSQGPLKDKIALIGIGVGNSPFEVNVFRKRYDIKFPLFPDGGYQAHKALGGPRTPYFLLIRMREPKLYIALANLGPFGEVSDFIAALQATITK